MLPNSGSTWLYAAHLPDKRRTKKGRNKGERNRGKKKKGSVFLVITHDEIDSSCVLDALKFLKLSEESLPDPFHRRPPLPRFKVSRSNYEFTPIAHLFLKEIIRTFFLKRHAGLNFNLKFLKI